MNIKKRVANLVEIPLAKLKNYHGKISWILFCLIFIFASGSWLTVNVFVINLSYNTITYKFCIKGMWSELPIMVKLIYYYQRAKLDIKRDYIGTSAARRLETAGSFDRGDSTIQHSADSFPHWQMASS